MKTLERTQRFLHLQGAGASPSDLLVPLHSLSSAFNLRTAAFITVFDGLKKGHSEQEFPRDFLLFPLGLLCGLSSFRDQAEPLGNMAITGVRHDAIIQDNDDLLRLPTFFGGPPDVSAPNIWGMPEMRSLLSLPDVYSSAFYACMPVLAQGRRPERVISNILSIKDAETKYTCPLPSHCGY